MITEPLTQVVPATKKGANELPSTTGVYIFCNDQKIVYIGKSVNIKARVLSHLENARLDPKEHAIAQNSTQIGCITTDSEFKALILESQLIQKYLPPYNVIWRDDKSYLYIKITMKEEFPKIFPVRREFDKKALYFGPFQSLRIVNEILKATRRVFPFCTQKNIGKKPCFYSKIGLCYPCPNAVNQLHGEEREKLAKEYKYNIRQVAKVLNGQTELVLKDLYKEVKELTKQGNYEEAMKMRNKIYRFEQFLHQRLFVSDSPLYYNQSTESVEALTQLLSEFFPQLTNISRVECYDISNFAFAQATASMVVFVDGLIRKDQYRRFKIKKQKPQSDFEMMKEVLQRRLKNDWPLPELLVVDGGKPQVRIALQALQELHVSIPLIGIAKHPDRLVIGKDNLPTIKPAVRNLGFNMIRALRDESHRFAKKYHTLLRNKRSFES